MLLASFSHQHLPMVCHWSLSDSKSSQVSKVFQYSSRSQQCCSLDGADPSSDFQLFQSPFQVFEDCSKRANYNWYPPPIFHNLLRSLARSKYLYLFSLSLNFTQWSARRAEFSRRQVVLFFSHISLGQVFWPRSSDLFESQNPSESYASYSLGRILVCPYTIWE